MKRPDDPVEAIVYDALLRANIEFEEGVSGRLDFYLPDHGVFIECKQFYSERIARQMSSVHNVIVIQGKDAAHAFATMITGKRQP